VRGRALPLAAKLRRPHEQEPRLMPAQLQTAQSLGRLGTESAFEVLARAKALEAQGKSIISLSIGQPDFPTPPHIVEAAVKALRDGHHGYTPANGILE